VKNGDTVGAIQDIVDEQDLHKDSTLQSIEKLAEVIEFLHTRQGSIETIVALGSGGGALVNALGEIVGASTVHAIDCDPERLSKASERGLKTHQVDLESERISLDDESADLVVSFGLLEHLTWYDHVMMETTRLLRDQGYLVFALPNMAGWTNRLSILTGHQPRNVEFSRRSPFGILDAYDTDYPVGHVHAPTVGAFKSFLSHHEVTVLRTVGLHPYQTSTAVKLIDGLVSWRPSLCRRFAVLGRYDPANESS